MPDDLPDFNKLWNYNDPAATEQKFREVLPLAQSSGDVSYELQLLTQIARCQGLQKRFADADATLDAVDARLTPELKLARARCLLERGRVLRDTGRAAEAIKLFHEAYDVAASVNEMRHAIDAIHMVAIAVPTPDERITWNEKCLKLIDANPGHEGWLPSVLNNLGEALRARGDYQRSLECFQRLLEFDKSRGREPWLYNRVDEARLLRLTGRVAEALDRIQAIAAQLKEPDGFVEEEWGESLLACGRGEESKPHSQSAWRLLQSETWIGEQEPERWERLRTLAC
jgi:tetratricopeptide (TPR) repeat protein